MKRRITWSVTITLLIILAFMDEANRMRGGGKSYGGTSNQDGATSVGVMAHHGHMKHLYRFLKKTRIIPIPIIIPVHHSHQ